MLYLISIWCTSTLFYPSNEAFLYRSIGQISIDCESSSKDGMIHVAIYNNPESFPDEGAHFITQKFKCSEKTNKPIQINGLPFGIYAVAVYQDLNGNNKLDRNVWGIPTEPYGFSNNPKAKWQKPSFKEAAFSLKDNQMSLNIQVLNWKSR